MLAPALMHIGGVDAESAREVRASEGKCRPADNYSSRRVQFNTIADICHRIADPIVSFPLRRQTVNPSEETRTRAM